MCRCSDAGASQTAKSQLRNRPFHFAKLCEIKIKFFSNVLADCCYIVIAAVQCQSCRSKPRNPVCAQQCSVFFKGQIKFCVQLVLPQHVLPSKKSDSSSNCRSKTMNFQPYLQQTSSEETFGDQQKGSMHSLSSIFMWLCKLYQ